MHASFLPRVGGGEGGATLESGFTGPGDRCWPVGPSIGAAVRDRDCDGCRLDAPSPRWRAGRPQAGPAEALEGRPASRLPARAHRGPARRHHRGDSGAAFERGRCLGFGRHDLDLPRSGRSDVQKRPPTCPSRTVLTRREDWFESRRDVDRDQPGLPASKLGKKASKNRGAVQSARRGGYPTNASELARLVDNVGVASLPANQ